MSEALKDDDIETIRTNEAMSREVLNAASKLCEIADHFTKHESLSAKKIDVTSLLILATVTAAVHEGIEEANHTFSLGPISAYLNINIVRPANQE